jgi:hypothetical protein
MIFLAETRYHKGKPATRAGLEFQKLVIRTGFKPVTRSLEGCCSIQLSYRTVV